MLYSSGPLRMPHHVAEASDGPLPRPRRARERTATATLLKDFQGRAKVDFITLGASRDLAAFLDPSWPDNLDQLGFDGTVEASRAPGNIYQVWMTVHDPTRGDLQTLIHELPKVEVQKLEIAVDFDYVGESSRAEANEQLFDRLAHGLSPVTTPFTGRFTMKQARQTPVLKRDGSPKYKYTRLKTLRDLSPSRETLLWESPRGFQVRLYVKTHDRRREIMLDKPVVRLEVTFKSRGGLQLLGVNKAGLIADGVRFWRSMAAPFLSMGRGIRPKRWQQRLRPDRARRASTRSSLKQRQQRRDETHAEHWRRDGGHFCTIAEFDVVPDRDVNMVIEQALKRLVERLAGLEPPKTVADFSAWAAEERSQYDLFPQGWPPQIRRTDRT